MSGSKSEKKSYDGKNDIYVTLAGEADARLEEKRSIFIGHARPISSEEEAAAFIKENKRKYSDATHNVFGYILNRGITARYSDDGEPQGTAGMPVLDVIRKSGIDGACIVVTRYFGGTLLGAGGLVRAYSAAAKAAVVAAGIARYEKYTEFCFSCPYTDYGRYNTELPKLGVIIDGSEFAVDVKITAAVRTAELNVVFNRLREMSAGTATPEICGERMIATRTE